MLKSNSSVEGLNEKRSGTFWVLPSRQIFGELRIAGEESELYLRDSAPFDSDFSAGGAIKGTLHDFTRVTLLHCVTVEGCGEAWSDSGRYNFARLFPHYAVVGSRHFEDSEDAVHAISFVMNDASTLFHDPDAFSSVLDAGAHIETLIKATDRGREVQVGPDSIIVYFTGKTEIITVDTVVGQVAVKHMASSSLSGPSGVAINNQITVTLTPPNPTSFRTARQELSRLLRFFSIIIGRPQSLNRIWISTGPEGADIPLEVVETLGLTSLQVTLRHKERPHPSDLMLNPVKRQEEFSRVLSNWLACDEKRRDARSRFASAFGGGYAYSIDRLVGAANMFDILPADAAPKAAVIPPEVAEAKRISYAEFKAIPASPERQSILDALARLGKSSLRQKILHRADIVQCRARPHFPELDEVVGAAVKCRNHYVHGGNSRIDYVMHPHAVQFFTDTLEFIFAMSELVEAGLDLSQWLGERTVMLHPFRRFKANYVSNLSAFHDAVSAKRSS